MDDSPVVFILAGGLGKRLRSVVNDRPKALAKINNKTFFDMQLNWLSKQGIREVVILTGYMSQHIESHIGDGASWDMKISVIKEHKPLGTGGAILNSLEKLKSEEELILINGDSLTEVSLIDFIKKSREKMATNIVTVFRKDSNRFGTLKFDKNNNLIGFLEKNTDSQGGWINTGIYYFPKKWFNGMGIKEQPISLEKHFFPMWISDKKDIHVFIVKGNFIDIGTPESLSFFKKKFNIWNKIL